MIQVKGLVIKSEAGSLQTNSLLNGIDLSVERGEIVAILGNNGAGKSTLLKAISGDMKVHQGEIRVDGKAFTNMPKHKRFRDITMLCQDTRLGTFNALSVEENLALAFLRGKNRGLRFALKSKLRQEIGMRIKDLSLDMEDSLDKKIEELSGGQRQIIYLLMAMMSFSKIILLDEHTAALDPKMSVKVMNLTRKLIIENNLTALLVTHNILYALEYSSRIIVLQQGKIIKDYKGQDKKNLSESELKAELMNI